MLVEQLAMKVEQSQKAGPQSKKERDAFSSSVIRMQTKSPAREEHVRPRVAFERLALKVEQSHKAVPPVTKRCPQSKKLGSCPLVQRHFVRTQTKSAAEEQHVTPLDSGTANIVPEDAKCPGCMPSREIASDAWKGAFEDMF